MWKSAYVDLDHELTAMGHSDRLGDMVICTEEIVVQVFRQHVVA